MRHPLANEDIFPLSDGLGWAVEPESADQIKFSAQYKEGEIYH